MLRLSPRHFAIRTLAVSLFYFAFISADAAADMSKENYGAKPPFCPTGVLTLHSERANAGCLVVAENALLVVKDLRGRISIPGGSANAGETAACTAFRETWEETSLAVRPTKLEARWKNGFLIFNCEIEKSSGKTKVQRPLEIREVLWIKPEQFDSYQWRFTDQKEWLRQWLQKHVEAK